ncbi:MAG: LuxR family transcriptional regulator, partial [Acidimicrobiales bacterium]
ATLRGTATRTSASLPFGAFAALLPELAPGTDRTDRADVLRQVARAIAARGAGRPVAVLVDDAHLLDESSASLTLQLVTNGDAFVVATVRSTEPACDAVVALWKDGLTERIDVHPLALADVDDVLCAALGGAIDRATVRMLWERTEGNALFLRELVLGALDAGVLRHDGGLWRLRGDLPATSRLVELVEARLQRLDDGERRTLVVLAVGEPLGIDLIERLSGGVLAEHLEGRGVLRVDEDGRRVNVRLGHPLYGEVLRARLSPTRARAVSRSLADALADVGARRREDVLRLATWRLECGDRRDPALLLAGARQAHARHDPALAGRLARAAWEAGGGFGAGLLLATVVSQAAGPDEAETIFACLTAEVSDTSG